MGVKYWLEEELKAVTKFLFQTKLDIKDNHLMGEDFEGVIYLFS